MPERHRPLPLEDVAVEIDAQDVLGPELLPQQQPRIAEQRAVGLAVGDVPGQVVVVALVPEGAGQQDQLQCGRQLAGRSVSGVGRNGGAVTAALISGRGQR